LGRVSENTGVVGGFDGHGHWRFRHVVPPLGRTAQFRTRFHQTDPTLVHHAFHCQAYENGAKSKAPLRSVSGSNRSQRGSGRRR
jgi:hypothetical protein